MKAREAAKKEREAKLLAEASASTRPGGASTPAVDDLHGLRCHSWVLVLAGKREVPETFFIEASTGHALSPLDDNYHGIEAVWNSK